MKNKGLQGKSIVDFDAFYQDPVNENICYYGFCELGTTSFTDKKWAILRESVADGITKRQWSNGTMSGTEDFVKASLSAKKYSFLK